jgi:tRNA 2-thiouridine synthesizing protein A
MAEMAGDEATAVVLDAQGLLCPLPVLRARKAMKEVPAGGLLRVLATDPGAVKDFQHFCEATGSTLLESRESEGVFTFLIRKAA